MRFKVNLIFHTLFWTAGDWSYLQLWCSITGSYQFSC